MRTSGALFVSALLVIACTAPTEREAPGDIIYESEATDEAWLTIDDATPTIDDASAPHLLTPTGTIASAVAPTFTWDGGAVAGAMVRGLPARPSFFARLEAELFPVAHAHEPPVTGAMYGLYFDLGAMAPVRVLTGATTYTPDAASWARITAATSAVTLEITGTYLNTGRIEQGPYVRTTPATLTID
jgi:hypothetical protein